MPADAKDDRNATSNELRCRTEHRWHAARWLPLAVTIAAMAVLAGASCGRSIYPKASTSPTPTNTPGNGNFVYLTNFNDGKISGFSRNLTTGVLKLVSTTAAGSAKGPYGLVAAGSGKYLYVTNAADNNVREYSIDPHTGKLATLGSGSITAGTSPRQLAIDPSSAFLYATNFGNGSVSYYAISSSGTLGSAGTLSGFSVPFGVVSATVNNIEFLYVSDQGVNSVRSFQLSSGVPGSVGVPVAIADPAQMAADSSGTYIFVVSPSTGVLYQLSTAGGALALVSFATTGGATNLPTGVAVANPSGGGEFIYTANQAANSVSVFTLNSVTHVLQLVSATTANLSAPTGLAADPAGAFLYVTNNGNGTVAQFSINSTTGALTALSPGTVPTESGSGHSGSGPAYIVVAD